MDLYKSTLLALSLVVLGGCRLTVSVDGDGVVKSDNGKIECPRDCKAKLKRGKEMTLTATANTGSYFAGWSGCEEEEGTTCVVVGGTKNRRVSAEFVEDKSIDESDLSQDLKDCITNDDNNYELTNKLSDVLKLECDAGNDTFDAAGADALANVTSLIISDGNNGIESLEDIANMPKLETLKLTKMGLDDVSDLEDLNPETLSTLDLTGNPSFDCAPIDRMEISFPDTTISTDQCVN